MSKVYDDTYLDLYLSLIVKDFALKLDLRTEKSGTRVTAGDLYIKLDGISVSESMLTETTRSTANTSEGSPAVSRSSTDSANSSTTASTTTQSSNPTSPQQTARPSTPAPPTNGRSPAPSGQGSNATSSSQSSTASNGGKLVSGLAFILIMLLSIIDCNYS